MAVNVAEQIKERLTINSVVWYYLKWKKDNKWNQKYKCPFHWDWNEKTPSLYVNDERGVFKCFWCWKYWDHINFVRDFDKENQLSFYEALEQLKDDFSDELQDVDISWNIWNDKDYLYKKLIYEFHKEINDLMCSELFSHEWRNILKYLTEERKLDIELIKKFEIGYAEWRKIEDKIKELQKTEKYKTLKLKDTGFFTTNTKWWEIYFLFADRIMYPIFNNRKKIIGWSGWKTMTDQEPKYINSVNNYIYNKSVNLFNYDKINFKENDTIYICEWNLDSTQLYNYGSDNALSLLWTNLTDTQINLFKHKIKYVVLLLDNDNAWQKAIEKISWLLLSNWLIPFIVNLNPYKDIDDFLKAHTELKWNIKEYIYKNKKDILKDYLIKWYETNKEKMNIEQKYNVLKQIKDLYEFITDDIIRVIYKNELAKYDIEFENLEKEYLELKKEEDNNFNNADKVNIDKISKQKWGQDKIILYAIYLLINWYISEDDIVSRNFELMMILNSNDNYIKYKDNKDQFEIDFNEYMIEFDLIKNTKEFVLFE